MGNIYHNKLVDFTKEPLFFGRKNSQRYDVLKYPVLDKLYIKQNGQFWTFDEISLEKDKQDFENLPENMKFIYTSVLQRLILLDSLQGRGMLECFGALISNPELEALVTVWQNFELIHSRSYSHILRSVYPDPTKIFDEAFKVKPILEIAESISQHYEHCFNKQVEYLHTDCNWKEAKKAILRLILEINTLEGIRFYAGFASIWAMHYSQGLMERTSKILSLIARDENCHLAMTQTLLHILSTRKDEGFIEVYSEIKPQIPKIYNDIVKQELDWVDFLFSKGEFLGLSSSLLKEYLKYICDRRLKAIKEDSIFNVDSNPLSWTLNYINMDANEVLPQEVEVINYKTDIFDSKISDEKLSSFLKEIK